MSLTGLLTITQTDPISAVVQIVLDCTLLQECGEGGLALQTGTRGTCRGAVTPPNVLTLVDLAIKTNNVITGRCYFTAKKTELYKLV